MLRLLLGVVGLVGVLVALPLLFVGGGMFIVDATLTDSDGFIQSAVMDVEVDGFALVAGPAEIEELPELPDSPVNLGEIATIRVQAENRDGTRGTFIGVAPSESLDLYLGGVTYAVVEDASEDEMFLTYRMNASGEPLPMPGDQTFWTHSAVGSGPQYLEWDLEQGDYSIVIMNEDASDGLAIDAVTGVRIPLLGPVSVGLLIGGGVTLALGTILLALAL